MANDVLRIHIHDERPATVLMSISRRLETLNQAVLRLVRTPKRPAE
jgi:hypothetical protein